MKKLVILSMAFLLVVSLGFALKPVPVTTIKQSTSTLKKGVSSTTLSKTNAGTVVTKTEGTALPDKTGVTLEDPGVPSTTAGKTANTGTGKVVLPGNSKTVPSTTVGRDITIDKGDIKGGINPVATDETESQKATFSIADYMPTTGTKTSVTNPVSGNTKTVGKTTLKTGTVKETQDVMKR